MISALATGVIAYTKTRSSMESAAQDKLRSLLESRKSSLTQYFNTIIHQVTQQGHNPLIIDSVNKFGSAWDELETNQTKKLQKLYIYNNPFKVGKKNLFLSAADDSNYTALHRKKHPMLSNMIDVDSYYDMFLVNTEGNLLYTVTKELDFATNLFTGPWLNTGIANLFRLIDTNKLQGKVYISDFAPYAPSHGSPAGFIGTAVFDNKNKYIGAIIFQLPIEPIDKIMQVTAGMGKSGETYAVGPDFLMRSNSRFFKDRSILTTRVETFSASSALLGKSGFTIIDDYRNISVYSAYTPFSILSLKWAMLAEIDEAEVLKPVYELSKFLIISGFLITLVIFIFGYLLSSDISQPIVAMTDMMKRLSDNDLDVNISVDNRKDEIGKMAQALVVFKQNAIERESLKNELIKIADLDSLTGLYSRKYAMDKIEILIKNSQVLQQKLVLMFIDLDNFKNINDSYGHHIGDQALCSIANYLKSCVRKNDIIARLGGDEFIIIFPNIEEVSNITPIADKILSSSANCELSVTLSIGLSVYPDDADNAKSLLQYADSAMYKVKNTGKNNFGYWKKKA